MIYDDLDRHLAAAGSFDRAAVPMGMYLAWCANLQLLSDELMDAMQSLVLRVRFREVTGSELAVAGCGGALRAGHLNSEGRAFTEAFYGAFYDEYRAEFGADVYAVEDDWPNYDRLARRLTQRLMAFRNAASAPDGGTAKPWWKRWG